MILLLSLILSVVIMVLGIWLATTTQHTKELLLNQLSLKDQILSKKDLEIQRLTTILVSKDPMTYQILSSSPEGSQNNPSEVIGIGTDEDEYARYAELHGIPKTDDDFSEDFQMLGFSG